MQTSATITTIQLDEVVAAIFKQGEVVVTEANSEYDSPLKSFPDANALSEDLKRKDTSGFFFYSIYYPEAGGHINERRVDLIPKKCNGHTYRFKLEGWGLIHMQCRFQDPYSLKCNIAVNSEARASNWSDTCPEIGDPAKWDWKIVSSKAGRLVRLLRKLGKEKEGEQVGAGDAEEAV
jgi:hypothetical protein